MTDIYGAASGKLAFLLGVEAGAAVLLVGSRPEAFPDDAAQFFGRCDTAADARAVDAAPGTYDLVYWDASSETDGGSLDERAAALARVLTAQGGLVMLAANRWSRAGNRRRRLAPRATAAWSLPATRRALHRAGLAAVRSYLAMPSLPAWGEAVATHGEPTRITSYAPLALRVAHGVGLRRWLHDGYILVAGRAANPLDRTARRMAGALGRAGEPLAITRFALRRRGALVLTLRAGGGAGAIARVASTPEQDQRVRINAERIAALVADPRVPPAVRAQLPEPLGSTAVDGRQLYFESRIEGHLAWQVARNRATRAVIDRDAQQFINALAQGSIQLAAPGSPGVEELLEGSVRSDFAETAAPDAAALALEIAASLRRELGACRVPLVIAHGDFGYGNFIVAPGGRLRGVFDWDTSRSAELWGVDWFNLLLQRRRGESHASFYEAVRDPSLPADASVAGLWLEGCTAAERGVLEAVAYRLACLRYVTRAARYPSEFHGTIGEYLSVLSWLRETRAA